MAFVGTSLFAWMIYVNMSTTLGVYLRNQHGVPESGYGWLLSLNAIMVVLFQFSVTQWTGKRPLLPMMALGTMFLAIGLGMYAFVASYTLFAIAMAILTIGELIAFPISAALVASFAPQNMRGRYNFIFYDSWVIAYAIGPYLAGLILDNLDPSLLWYACAGLGLVTTLIFLWLHLWIHPRTVPTVQKA
jgi:MFS family permease